MKSIDDGQSTNVAAPDSEPTFTELEQDLPDSELQQKGLQFTAKYLIYKAIAVCGYENIQGIDFTSVNRRLKELFPMEEGGRLSNYLWSHIFVFRSSFDWATAKYYQEWKVSRVAKHMGGASRKDATAVLEINEMLEGAARKLGIL